MASKTGRNEPCPCGSGKKYKHCHGGPAQLDRVAGAIAAARADLPRHAAEERQRIAQQGLGRPIISADVAGQKIVAVGNKVFHSPTVKTFADFLLHYIGTTIDREWGNAELAKPEAEMHPIALWHRRNAFHQRQHAKEPGKVFGAPEIGASRALLELSYNLYLLEHNAELRTRLLDRLTHPDQFLGALSEVRVAGMFVRAGYEIAFEDEDDRRRTHCEYHVMRPATGKQFSVEVKTRHWPGDGYPANDPHGLTEIRKHVGRQVRAALSKQAQQERIIFVELAMPHHGSQNAEPWWMQAAEDGVREAERLLIQHGVDPPSAIVVVMNHPHHLQLQVTDSVVGLLLTGTGASEFKRVKKEGTLHEAVKFKRRHADFLALWQSVQQHRRIPTTFDGSNPHLAFGEHPPPYQVGATYDVSGPDGRPVAATLEDAVAIPTERKVHGIYRSQDGQRFHVTGPMTDAEVAAYAEHPDTFFGAVKPQGKANGPLELFDFFFESYGNLPKERLLELLAAAKTPDLEDLAKLSREDLADTYCERMVYGAMAQTSARQTP
jgi:hypothetical protein